MRLIAKNLLLSLCIFSAILLILSHLFTGINPTTFSFPALLSLFFPVLLIINIIFLLIWFFRRHWGILIPIVALFVTWSQVDKMYAFQSESEVGTDAIKVLSYNVKNFDLYNWESNVKARNNIAKVIKSIDADVINFQEFYTRDNHELDNLKYIKQNLKLPYYHFSKRGKQADKLTIHAKGSPHPVVITGDFNDTPNSYTYEVIGKERKDAFLEAGKGLGFTYAGPIPGLRIDYIFTDEDIKVSNFETLKKGKSDHYPISCYVELGE